MYKEKRLSPFSGNDVDRITGSNIPFCTNSSLLARTEIFLSSAINKGKETSENVIILSVLLSVTRSLNGTIIFATRYRAR